MLQHGNHNPVLFLCPVDMYPRAFFPFPLQFLFSSVVYHIPVALQYFPLRKSNAPLHPPPLRTLSDPRRQWYYPVLSSSYYHGQHNHRSCHVIISSQASCNRRHRAPHSCCSVIHLETKIRKKQTFPESCDSSLSTKPPFCDHVCSKARKL